jgi:ABC-type lipoprotein export system ATPase subunit
VKGAVVELRDVFCVHRTDEGDAAALQGTTLDLARGELLCVVGPSGAGKSTLLRVIAGIQQPSAGTVGVLGSDVGRLPEGARARLRHRQLGLLSQDTVAALPPDLPARDAVALPLALRGVGRPARRARVDELLEAAALGARADARPGELSGGERQRFALCAALAHRPALLLADEPTGELDEASAEGVRTLIAELARNQGASVIVVSHDAAMASVADRAVGIRDGRVVDDRRDGERALIIGQGGWLQLPSELLAATAIGRRARVRAVPGGLMVTAAEIEAEAEAGLPAATATDRAADGAWTPARVRLRWVSRSYGRGRLRRAVIDNVTHSFAPGRMTVVTGRSGVGKTTLLRMLAALDSPDGGRLLIDERPLHAWDGEQLAAVRRARIGYLPQEPSPVGFLSAEENVVLALRVRGWQAEAARERAAVALARVGIADRARQRVERLSAGERQRVALARALASARGLLIVDEPTSRLDEASAVCAAELIARAAADENQTVICATHDPEVIKRADEVVTLGPVVGASPGPEFETHPSAGT